MNYGNLAYKLDVPEEKKKAVEPVKKPKLKQKRDIRPIIVVVLVSAAAYFMISRNVVLYGTNQQIKSLEKELASLESYTSQKVFELEQNVDLATVEEIATTRLNMQRPEKYQTEYVNIEYDDETEITADKVEGVKSRVGKFGNSVRKNILGIFMPIGK